MVNISSAIKIFIFQITFVKKKRELKNLDVSWAF